MKNPVKKTYLKTWVIHNFYKYKIYEIDAGCEKWLQSDPETKGLVCRTAENEYVLRIILENDCINYTRFQKERVR